MKDAFRIIRSWSVPGGFSYGDDIAAGKVLANELKAKIGRGYSAVYFETAD